MITWVKQSPIWIKVALAVLPTLGTAAVVVPPYVGLPDVVAAHGDSIRSQGHRIERVEDNDGEVLCLLRLILQEEEPGNEDVLCCGDEQCRTSR